MAKKKPARKTSGSKRVQSRRASVRARRQPTSATFVRYGFPIVVAVMLVASIVVVGVMFYRNVTTSEFFTPQAIDVRGTNRISVEEVRRAVAMGVDKNGVWHADLDEIRARIEKFPFVKTASVSRALPNGIRVDVQEREPVALVRLESGDHVVDAEGVLLARAGTRDAFPFVLRGWDETKTEKAYKDNLARVKAYTKMADEWKQFGLISRVKQVDLVDLREPVATVEDSGRAITVMLARDSLGPSLRAAIEAVSGKGAKIRSVNSEGISPVITYLDPGNEQ